MMPGGQVSKSPCPHVQAEKSPLSRVFAFAGRNGLPPTRDQLAHPKRKPPKHLLPHSVWTELPKLDPGPGMDVVYKRLEADRRVEAERVAAVVRFRFAAQATAQQRRARMEALDSRVFSANL